ncbi:uncharacterized protein [Watersipora subatra]|uniref:uncharacterized protein n=1 Tax=Watersipora subatra TaxID=2589382 RepID=UPI00355AF36D
MMRKNDVDQLSTIKLSQARNYSYTCTSPLQVQTLTHWLMPSSSNNPSSQKNNTTPIPASVLTDSVTHKRRHEGHQTQRESHNQLISTTRLPITHTTTSLPSTAALPSRNWLPNNAAYRALGLPENWFHTSRKRRSLQDDCIARLKSFGSYLLQQCSERHYRLTLPALGISEWMVEGFSASEIYGLELLEPISLTSTCTASLAIKAPPSNLLEGEQFQLHVSVISENLNKQINAHIRVIVSVEEALCFKNLMINSYPHANVTLGPTNQHAVASFTATSLRRGNFSISVELWVDEIKIGEEIILLKVTKELSDVVESPLPSTTEIPNMSTPDLPSSDYANLQVKMRYNKDDNTQRCKGFTLTVDHSLYEEKTLAEQEDNPFDDSSFLYRWKRSMGTHSVSRVPRHSLQICYRILQKSAHGSYYIDVESFSGYRTADHPVKTSDEDRCKLQMQSYDGGNIIMIENTIEENWCCFILILESTISNSHVLHTQANNSASVRMHNGNRPGDFCLEFYNLHTKSPYSDHICSDHGCLCTEKNLRSCHQAKHQSMRKTMQHLTRTYLSSRYVLRVRAEGHSTLQQDGIYSQLVTILDSSNSSSRPGPWLRTYYKAKPSCELFRAGATYILMGRQLHLQEGNNGVSSLYLDHEASVVNIDDLYERYADTVGVCHLDTLFCHTDISIDSYLSDADSEEVNSKADDISSTITNNCKYQQNMANSGVLQTLSDLFNLSGVVCQRDLSHVYEQRRLYQSIRRYRRRKRHRRKG